MNKVTQETNRNVFAQYQQYRIGLQQYPITIPVQSLSLKTKKRLKYFTVQDCQNCSISAHLYLIRHIICVQTQRMFQEQRKQFLRVQEENRNLSQKIQSESSIKDDLFVKSQALQTQLLQKEQERLRIVQFLSKAKKHLAEIVQGNQSQKGTL